MINIRCKGVSVLNIAKKKKRILCSLVSEATARSWATVCGCYSKDKRGKVCVRGSSGEDCAGHLLCKPENSLIQFIDCKSGCAACMRMATGQKVTDVWRHRLDVWYFVMHFKKRSLLSENVLKMLFSMCVWGHRYWVELYFFALMHNVFIHNSTNGSPPHIGHHLWNVRKKTVRTVIFISVQSSAYRISV